MRPIRHRRLRAVVLPVVALLALAGCTSSDPETPGPTGSASGEDPPAPEPAGARDVGVQLFQWSWDAIAQECPDVLGPAGYGWVLTSPPQEHILGEEWWTAYQPVSYQVESRLGTREQFAAMVQTCDEAGVAIVADAVINHMTGQSSPGVGWAGSSYEHYEYPGLYSDAEGDFHHCGMTLNDDIENYQDAYQVRTCELVNLADLATETERVRATLTAYLEDLLSLGVAGFRIDAAKHMPAEDIEAIVGGLPEGTKVLQEVIGAVEEPIQPAEYLDAGQVFDFSYPEDLVGLVGGGTLSRVAEIGTSATALPSQKAIVFVDNHDTERNGQTFSYKDAENYALANVMMLAWDYGTPVVYSGYAFSARDTGPLQTPEGEVVDAQCAAEIGPGVRLENGEWVCQHRWTPIQGMVGWRSAVGDAPVTDLWSERRVVAFGRGGAGFVAGNGGASEAEHTFTTSLAPGTWCDVLTGGLTADGACSGETVEVGEDGSFSATLGPDSAIALHVGARPEQQD